MVAKVQPSSGGRLKLEEGATDDYGGWREGTEKDGTGRGEKNEGGVSGVSRARAEFRNCEEDGCGLSESSGCVGWGFKKWWQRRKMTVVRVGLSGVDGGYGVEGGGEVARGKVMVLDGGTAMWLLRWRTVPWRLLKLREAARWLRGWQRLDGAVNGNGGSVMVEKDEGEFGSGGWRRSFDGGGGERWTVVFDVVARVLVVPRWLRVKDGDDGV
ncbi:hypothetical protein PIB30_036497 [Stylosanthes scabra]|uniref:Uncharacterized protein n=1 Tax=Stylosanthes scabra TaxID=79078 RepID=A0ABU6ZBQ6_9FABA|nr:hypothetical protein [Stylosanthes scabra]